MNIIIIIIRSHSRKVLPYFLSHWSKASHERWTGKSNRLPIIRWPFGPGGYLGSDFGFPKRLKKENRKIAPPKMKRSRSNKNSIKCAETNMLDAYRAEKYNMQSHIVAPRWRSGLLIVEGQIKCSGFDVAMPLIYDNCGKQRWKHHAGYEKLYENGCNEQHQAL